MLRFRVDGVECFVGDDLEVECSSGAVRAGVEFAVSQSVHPSEGFFWQVMAFRRIPEVLEVGAVEVLEITSIEDQSTPGVLY